MNTKVNILIFLVLVKIGDLVYWWPMFFFFSQICADGGADGRRGVDQPGHYYLQALRRCAISVAEKVAREQFSPPAPVHRNPKMVHGRGSRGGGAPTPFYLRRSAD